MKNLHVKNSVDRDGAYWRLSPRRGVKIPSAYVTHVRREAQCLKRLNKLTKLFPKFVRLQKFTIEGDTYLGIVMEHITGERNSRRFNRVEDDIIQQLAEKNIEWRDLHGRNVVFTSSNRFRCVDADPDFIIFFKRRRRRTCQIH